MVRISSSFSTGNWKTRTMMTTSLGMGTTPPRKTEEDPVVGSFLRAWSSDEDDDGDNGGDSDDGADSDDGSSSDNGARDDGSDGGSGDGDVDTSPPIKRRRFLGTYWW
jgi:hypothetical protein